MGQLLLVPRWSSAGNMSTALTIIMHFTGGFIQKARRNIPQMQRTSRTSWIKTLCCCPINRVNPITDSTEGTVEIFPLGSLKNNYCSMLSASYLRKKQILSNVLLLFHVFKLQLYQLVLL